MRSTSICSSGACGKLGEFTWEGMVVGSTKEKDHQASYLNALQDDVHSSLDFKPAISLKK